METLTTFTKGLEILEPFLKRHDFEFENYENQKGLGEQFTVATYKNGRKEFIINYLPPIGQVFYQFDKSKLYHNFYLDQLGLADNRRFKDFQSENKLVAFKDILYDFEFLVDDFFQGQCNKLKEFSNLHDNILTEYNKKAHKEFSVAFDKRKVEVARQEYRKKGLKKCLGIYREVENKNLLNDLDQQIIEYCERYIK